MKDFLYHNYSSILVLREREREREREFCGIMKWKVGKKEKKRKIDEREKEI